MSSMAGSDHSAFQDPRVLMSLGLGRHVADDVANAAFSISSQRSVSDQYGVGSIAAAALACRQASVGARHNRSIQKPFSKSAVFGFPGIDVESDIAGGQGEI